MRKTTVRVTGTDSVLYLRVSSKGQVDTDYDPEGISIPAQRVAGRKRAKELDSAVKQEFVDPGLTAKSIEKRQAFKDMIAYLGAHPNIKYVIVYALSRFARNRYDDSIMMATLERLGVTLISVTERNLDDTPAGRAMHGMIAVFNEYQVLASGEDIKYKMGQKVKNGGTASRAKLGYVNIRDHFEGREVRTIGLDEQRAPLVRQAFELFATGKYTQETLLAAITDLGLTMRPMGKLGERPVSSSTLALMLRDRYYTGKVQYQDKWYPGRHEAIVSEELFERVQRVLDAHSGSGARQRQWNHYLRGTLWCKRCGGRFVVQRAQGNGGVYFYYFCLGRRRGEQPCNQRHLLVADVEEAVTTHYATVRLSDEFQALCRAKFDAALNDELATTSHVKQRLTERLNKIDVQEDHYLELVGNPAWPQAKLDAKVSALQAERADIQEKLHKLDSSIEVGKQSFYQTLDYLRDPQALYRELSNTGRRLLNEMIFARLLVDSDDQGVRIAGDDLHEPFRTAVTVYRRHQSQQPELHRSYRHTAPQPAGWGDLAKLRDFEPHLANRGTLTTEDAPDWDTLTSADLLNAGLLDLGWNKAAMVGVVEALSYQTNETNRLYEVAATWPDSLTKQSYPTPKYRTMRQLRQDELDELVQAYQAGATVYDLAAQFGIDRRTVGHHLRARGVDTTPPGLHPDDIPAAVELYESGWSLVRIAEKFSTSGNTVRRRLLEIGIKMRAPHDRP